MLKLAVVVWIALWPGLAEAIIWEFDDGTTQGWVAKEIHTSGGPPEFNLFPGAVEDGVWKIDVSPSVTGDWSSPNVELISPTIGYDSRLFDQIWVRFRTVHHSPTVGFFWLVWTNDHNLISPGKDPDNRSKSRFMLSGQRDFVYTTEWQEVEFSFLGRDEVVWEGLLRDIRLNFVLDRNEDDVVGEIEIDWIELSGVEELLQGELPPPHVEYFRFDGAGFFAPPVFYPIAPGIGKGYGRQRTGILTDLDGDGDADLFASWDSEFPMLSIEEKSGWTMALNDGDGTFATVRTEEVGYGQIEVLGGDLTGDGKDEIVTHRLTEATEDEESGHMRVSGPATEVWSIGPDLQLEMLTEIDDRWLRDVADWDGDGDVELFVMKDTLEGSMLEVWDIENGMWTSSEVAAAENHLPAQIGDFTGDGMLEVLWVPFHGQANTQIVRALGDELQSGEIFEFDAEAKALRVGDFDNDGQVDLLTSFIRTRNEGLKGLVVRKGGTGGIVEEAVLYDERLFLNSPVMVRDLDADGVEDWVFIGGDRASGLGVFVEWGGGVNPTRAVERHRLQGHGVEVLSGDVDSDGALDLVVLDPLLGGVHVLKSSLGGQPTAVQTPTIIRPAQYRLGDSYPNPFNPTMVIPLNLATDQKQVHLALYDVLGRRVRQLWDGPLRAGSHRFTWDGRDEVGKGVAAGVYIYKVEVDGQIEAKKTTKLP